MAQNDPELEEIKKLMEKLDLTGNLYILTFMMIYLQLQFIIIIKYF